MKDNSQENIKIHIKDPELKKEWEYITERRAIAQAVYDLRKAEKLTQKELSDRSGVSMRYLRMIEKASGNPTLRMLQQLAHSMEKNLEIKFV